MWNTLPESYQQRVYQNTLATVKCQIQHVENPTPAVVITAEAVHINNAILLDYLTSEVALEEPEIAGTDANIQIANNCTEEELHFVMPGGSGNYKDESVESDERNAIPTANRRRLATPELNWFNLEPMDVDGSEGKDGDNVDANEEEAASEADDGSMQNVQDWGHSRLDLGPSDVDGDECRKGDGADTDEDEEASQADDGSTQNVEDCGHSTWECEDWTV